LLGAITPRPTSPPLANTCDSRRRVSVPRVPCTRLTSNPAQPSALPADPTSKWESGRWSPTRSLPAAAKNPFNTPSPGPNIFVPSVPDRPPPRCTPLPKMSAPVVEHFNFEVVFVGSVLRPRRDRELPLDSATPAILGGCARRGRDRGASPSAAHRRSSAADVISRSSRHSASHPAARRVVASQSTVAVRFGTILGVPAGILSGRLRGGVSQTKIHCGSPPRRSRPRSSLSSAVGGSRRLQQNIVAASPVTSCLTYPIATLLRGTRRLQKHDIPRTVSGASPHLGPIFKPPGALETFILKRSRLMSRGSCASLGTTPG